jgi:outer membrane protein assembly factor BamB
VFTGRELWETTLPFAHAATDELVVMPDAIYATGGRLCLVLDPATGEESGRIQLPEELPGIWRNLRCWGDYLVMTCGRFLVGMNRHTGEVLWRYECNRPALSVAVGGDRVFCAELLNRRRGETEQADVKTRALDMRTGEVLWEIPRGSNVMYSEPLDLLVNTSGIYHAADGQLHKSLPTPPQPEEGRPVPAPLFLVGEKLLWGTVESFAVFDLKTGEREGEETTWVRRGCTTIRASEKLVTTRVRANAAYINLETREATSLWNVRPACLNNLYPADGLLNAPNMLGGCTCNYTHASQGYVRIIEIIRATDWRKIR